jgi:hypothetical protein
MIHYRRYRCLFSYITSQTTVDRLLAHRSTIEQPSVVNIFRVVRREMCDESTTNVDEYNLSQFRGYDETIVRSIEDYAKIRTVYGDR